MVLANNPPNIYFRRNLVGPKHVSSVSATAEAGGGWSHDEVPWASLGI
jgi:hypothetical protein